MRIGVVACDIMKLELDKLLSKTPGITEIIYLEAALHCYPKKMKATILENVNAIKDKVDVIFLGYGFCNALQGIEDEIDIPVVMPQMDDCIQIFMTPQKYGEAIRKEVGTWFMSPGWAEIGAEMVIKENHLDRVVKYGKDPMEMAKRLFTHYRRGLFIDTGVGNDDYYIGKSNEFCDVFSLTLETTTGTSAVLEEHLEITQKVAAKVATAQAKVLKRGSIMKPDEVRQVVQERYGKFAETAGHAADSCCSKPAVKACCAHEQAIYSESELSSVPELARNLSRGCGNPTGFANLQPGEAVVDLGCGGGIDVILAARKVGAGGKVYGVDFTLQMIEQAKEAVAQASLPNRSVEFRHASLENTTLPNASADVVISNCVINLCPDKNAVYREAFRILKPGGRLAISDIMLTGPIDAELRERLQSVWAGCTGGAIPEGEYWDTLKNAGFTEIKVVARHLLSDPELDGMACCPGKEYTPAPAADDLNGVQGKVVSVKFTAIK